MRMMIKKLPFFLLVDLVFVAVLLLFGYVTFVLSFQMALLSSAFIVWSSYRGYKKLVDQTVPNEMTHYRDSIDKLDDPFDLYSEDETSSEEDLTLKKVKSQHLKNTLKTKSGFLSVMRLSAYLFLILSLFWLNNHGNFNIPGYLLGLGAGILLMIWLQQSSKSHLGDQS